MRERIKKALWRCTLKVLVWYVKFINLMIRVDRGEL